MGVSLSALVVAGITALVGFVVFVCRQLTLKFLFEPIQEQRRIIGRTAHALGYYANVYAESSPEAVAEGNKGYRDLAGELHASIRVIPLYSLCVRLNQVPSVERYGGDLTIKARHQVQDSLGIAKW